MKTLIFLLIFFAANKVSAQISASMRLGYAFKTVDAIIAPAINFRAHGLALTPEMVIYTKDNAPVCFGVKMSYEHTLLNDVSIEAGYGRYFDLYSTDGGSHLDSMNGWSNLLFGTIHFKRFFLEYGWNKQSVLSFGMRETIF